MGISGTPLRGPRFNKSVRKSRHSWVAVVFVTSALLAAVGVVGFSAITLPIRPPHGNSPLDLRPSTGSAASDVPINIQDATKTALPTTRRTEADFVDLTNHAIGTLRRPQTDSLAVQDQGPFLIDAVLAKTNSALKAVEIGLRVRTDWLEFADRFSLPESTAVQSDSLIVAEIVRQVDSHFAKLRAKGPILPLASVNHILASCHKDMKAEPTLLTPPHYLNEGLRVFWRPSDGSLRYMVGATVDRAQNKCLQGLIDLNSGELNCMPVACWVP
jgi:hypothetical protein